MWQDARLASREVKSDESMAIRPPRNSSLRYTRVLEAFMTSVPYNHRDTLSNSFGVDAIIGCKTNGYLSDSQISANAFQKFPR
jgi:hypothetical protein